MVGWLLVALTGLPTVAADVVVRDIGAADGSIRLEPPALAAPSDGDGHRAALTLVNGSDIAISAGITVRPVVAATEEGVETAAPLPPGWGSGAPGPGRWSGPETVRLAPGEEALIELVVFGTGSGSAGTEDVGAGSVVAIDVTIAPQDGTSSTTTKDPPDLRSLALLGVPPVSAPTLELDRDTGQLTISNESAAPTVVTVRTRVRSWTGVVGHDALTGAIVIGGESRRSLSLSTLNTAVPGPVTVEALAVGPGGEEVSGTWTSWPLQRDLLALAAVVLVLAAAIVLRRTIRARWRRQPTEE